MDIPLDRLVSKVEGNAGVWELNDLSFTRLWHKVCRYYKLAKDSKVYTLAYINTYWGQESSALHDQKTLSVAIANMHVYGSTTVIIPVSNSIYVTLRHS
jgi:hypothetical protein